MSFSWGGVRTLVSGIFAGALLLAILSSSAAAETHAFDPVLSLTGECTVSLFDEEPDPGLCPMPPGVPGVDHPKAPFANPRVVATDSYGDIYVGVGSGKAGRIDVFGSTGKFITEVVDELNPGALAIDEDGNLYVGNNESSSEPEDYVLYEPSEYEPAEEKITYNKPPKLIVNCGCTGGGASLDIDRSLNSGEGGRLFLLLSSVAIGVFKPAAEGNELIETISIPEGAQSLSSFVVDSAHGRLYLADRHKFGPEITDTEPVIQAIELEPPHALLFEVKGTAVPAGKFSPRSVAADEGSGHFFVYDALAKKVYEFDEDGNFFSMIEYGFQDVFGARIGVDNGIHSPNGALNPVERYLFIPSHPSGVGHSFAFGPPKEGPPKIQSVSFFDAGETEVELEASIEPFGLNTHYTFQYSTQQQFEEGGETFSGIPTVGEGEIPAGNTPVDVATAIEGLQPGTRYRFRVFAENAKGTDEAEDEFATFPAAEPPPLCANDPLRTGFSALLPDCRAYELVTPANTNGHPIIGLPRSAGGLSFPTRGASPTGGALSFLVEGGPIPGYEGTGSLRGDPYVATRGSMGWQTVAAGPNGVESGKLLQPGSVSPDQRYSFWGDTSGSKVTVPGQNNFLRYPNGDSEPIGRGSLGQDPNAAGELISENGGHVLFTSSSRLEEDAPTAGTQALYDRTIDPTTGAEQTHVVSLLPGDETPATGEKAFYTGASLDGKGVSFRIGNKLYLRFDDEETYELGEGLTFAGIAEGGARAFYLQGGRLWRFDAATEEAIEFSSGPVTPVNVSADGTVAYFVSQSVLTGEPNPNGAVAQGGEENLYRSEEGAISFVGTVTERDVKGESLNFAFDGLGLWINSLQEHRPVTDASRTTPDGRTLLFQSRADLAGYDPQGHSEIYRYDFAANELDCLSCNPTLAPAATDAVLVSISQGWGQDSLPVQSFADLRNLRTDGERAFFQSSEALVPSDVDGLQDVYEWESQAVGSCERAGGCLYLISSGNSPGPDYLYALSDSGDDAFIFTPDLLLPDQDPDETPSVYDARAGGGFLIDETDEECIGESCQATAVPPARSPLASSVFEGAGNVAPKKKHCRKSGSGVKRHCTRHRKHHRHHKRHSKPSAKGGTGR
jgi:hypothetical protein